MSLKGARGLARISQNPKCDLQTTIMVAQLDEIELFETVTDRPFEGEFGERQSAIRRGGNFETNLHQNNAAGLRRIIAPLFGYDPEEMYVRNLSEEVPDKSPEYRLRRYQRTARIFDDLGRNLGQMKKSPFMPDLIIQPQFRLPLGGGPFVYIAPDFVVFDKRAGIYVVGEEKSMIVRNGSPDHADLEQARRQAGAEALALRLEAARVGLAARARNRAVFVFASPYGVAPSRPVEETLNAEVREIRRALSSYRTIAGRIKEGREDVNLVGVASRITKINFNYQNSCVKACAMADVCRSRVSDTASVLGEAASSVFGGGAKIMRLYELMRGRAVPQTSEEISLAPRLREAFAALRIDEGSNRLRLVGGAA